MAAGYEFKKEENDLIGSLASKMSVVGLVNVIVGLLYFLSAALTLAFIFQDKLPADVVAKIPEDVKGKVPDVQYLWGVFIQLAVAGLIFFMVGIWTRSAAASFKDIVATAGRDISHLMNALTALYKMYSLLFTIIIVTLLASLIGIGLQLYLKYAV